MRRIVWQLENNAEGRRHRAPRRPAARSAVARRLATVIGATALVATASVGLAGAALADGTNAPGAPQCQTAPVQWSVDGVTWHATTPRSYPKYPMVSVQVRFDPSADISNPCPATFSLNSYNTEGPTWPTTGTQTLLQHVSVTLDNTHPLMSMTVKTPACYGQTDLYPGSTAYDGSSSDSPVPQYPSTTIPGIIASSNGGSACAPPPGEPKLTITKLAPTKSISLSDPSTPSNWQITVENAGTASATGPLTVTDTLPKGLLYHSFSGTGWSCTSSANKTVVTCTYAADLAAGAKTTVTVATTVAPGTENIAEICNTAHLGDLASNTACVGAVAGVVYHQTTPPAVKPAVAPAELPHTGAVSVPLALSGGALLLLGTALVASTRRRRGDLAA